ncbi:DUF883 family protein [Litoreibacter janthinus]|uniref:Membrane-anchored ribosome-binding protein, inhibits growth in stationary phase, ElaB/YqjD/DUF883 family n=1 Tax=Litoreibacter janthinus TaxID=670154 RepID=A0A1I6GC24_9RHOB|nr:DUF883 family protein [Litoreibacter janthinus]SFR39691.1 Membrane-anchored ribosome-binding protein, inhibits growth in stationary phase, ElaB/YqjD/DUF883 family [Litoreibacter janthinus]
MARATAKLEEISTPNSEDVAAQLATLKSDLIGLTEIIAEMSKGKAGEISEVAKAKAEAARASGAEQYEKAKERAADLQNQANDFVIKQPATSLAIAAGAGFLIGFLSNRR